MSYLNDESMYREIIMDHVKNPRNIKTPNDHYRKTYLKNPSCGDELYLYVDYDETTNTIKDITYKVTGCSICCSSVSMMSELLTNKSKLEMALIIENFNNMVTGKEYNPEVLGDAVSLKGIVNVPPRIKCATLGYKALLQILGEDHE
ncbi:MAG: SUF system NifU family Fe-S cluster assembly protein [Bacilli bacterium]|nr:SUF system NifU family Fe-S cluster assembly protein [Bacilli bacterium]MDD4547580.1 SUF system NifU family Fe-S cluster assembly protein [Bacilli bacterium]